MLHVSRYLYPGIKAISLAFIIMVGCKSPAASHLPANTGNITGTKPQVSSFDEQMNVLANEMVKSLSQEKKSKIAIMEFPDLNGQVSELGKFIPEELTTRFFRTKRFDVVERQLINKVIDEQRLGVSGMLDANSAAEIGKMLGVEAIVTGTITDIGASIRINARMIATQTGSVFAVSSANISKDDYILALMKKIPAHDTYSHSIGSQETTHANITKTLSKNTVDGIDFEVVSAKIVPGDHILIDVVVTNTSRTDKEVRINNNTRLYDNLGQEFLNPVRSIGAKKTQYRSEDLSHLYIAGIPTKVTLDFSNIDPTANSIALLKIQGWGLSTEVLLRNIPLSK